jgi:hypothetical protein
MDTDEKLDRIMDDLTEIKIVQAEQHMTLKEHTRRSSASEARITIVEALAAKTWTALQKHFAYLKGLGSISLGLGVLYGLINLYLKLRSM